MTAPTISNWYLQVKMERHTLLSGLINDPFLLKKILSFERIFFGYMAYG